MPGRTGPTLRQHPAELGTWDTGRGTQGTSMPPATAGQGLPSRLALRAPAARARGWRGHGWLSGTVPCRVRRTAECSAASSSQQAAVQAVMLLMRRFPCLTLRSRFGLRG